MPPRYKVATLVDIARMPKDTWPRFIKELPEMLGMIREMDKFTQAAVEDMPEEEGKKALEQSRQSIVNGLEWIDDGQEHFDMKMRGQDMEGHEHMVMTASTREREVSVKIEGKDRTYDFLLAKALREAGFPMDDENTAEIMPTGQVNLLSIDLPMIKDVTPQAFKEMCVSANRQLTITKNKGYEINKDWREAADHIAE